MSEIDLGDITVAATATVTWEDRDAPSAPSYDTDAGPSAARPVPPPVMPDSAPTDAFASPPQLYAQDTGPVAERAIVVPDPYAVKGYLFTPTHTFKWLREDGSLWNQYEEGTVYTCSKEPKHDLLRKKVRDWVSRGWISIVEEI